jgi:FkbM family methyltransferase
MLWTYCTSDSDVDYTDIWKGYLHMPHNTISDWQKKSIKTSELVTRTHNDPKWRLYSRASAKEDIWLYERLFYGVQYGLVVESGAGNGVDMSMSYFFEHFANWTALLIEPDPASFKHLLDDRPNAIAVNVGLCAEPSVLKFATSALSGRHGFVEFIPSTYKRRWHANSSKVSMSMLPCIPIQAILDRLQISQVDLWVIDAEGAEEVALRGIDFNRVIVSVIIIDSELHAQVGSTSRFDYLRQYGFRCHANKWNIVCVNNIFKKSTSNKLIFS